MTTHEIRTALFEKLKILNSSCRIAEDKTTVGNNAGETSQTRTREMASLVSEAVKRIENETFGTCVECEEEIGENRLRAIPWASYCIHCQDLRDSAPARTRYAKAIFRPHFAD